jgi:hypothetical protein
MRAATHTRTLLAVTLLAMTLLICIPSSAVALTFAEAPGSPYSTTAQHFVPSPGGLLGGAVAGDFNGDGISDLAVVNATGLPAFSSGESVTVLLGHPDGMLTIAPGSPVELYSGGIYASYGVIATGDFTNDGDLDLAVVDNIHDTISILLGDGTGRFRLSGAPIPFSGEAPNAIAVGDFNGDGVEDLAFASDGSVNVLLGNGSGGFTPASGSPFAVAGHARSVVTGDFNGDGRSDLAVTTSANQVAVYLATGDGQFQEAEGSPLPTGEGPASIVAADLSGNGRTDLAIANESSDNVTVLLGSGSGGFTPAEGSPFTVPAGAGSSPSMPGLPQSIAAGDFSGNGNMDLAVANFNGSSDNVAILQGDGHGGFTNAIGSPFPANGNPRSVVVGDFNGDRRPDLAVVNSFQGVVTVLLNTTTQAAREVPPPSPNPPNSPPIVSPLTPPLTAPTRAQILTLLARQLGPSGDWARLRLSAKNASFAFRFSALEAGTATIVWYGKSLSRSQARHAHAKRVILAQGRLKFSDAAATMMMRISFTKAGLVLWKQAKRLQLTATGTFQPVGTTPIIATRTFVLKK